MIDDSEWARMARYLAGEGTPDDLAATRRWIDEDPRRRELLDALEPVWRRSATPAAVWDTARAWERVSARARRVDRLRITAGRAVARPRRLQSLLVPIAATIVAAAGLALAVRARPTPPTPPESVPDREYHTAAGQRAVVNLMDGTRVELGVQSTLRLPSSTGARREAYLDGEAVFTVAHDSLHPFLVHARDAVAEDIGTRFNVRAYPGDSAVHVVVMSGEVALGAASDTVRRLLRAGDDGAVSGGAISLTRRADTAAVLGWTRDRFVARTLPLRDVARQLERWFDVRIEIRDSTDAARRVTIDVPATRLTDIVGAATAPLGLLYSQNGRTIVIRRPASRRGADSVSSRRSDQ